MLNHPTLDQLHALDLYRTAKALIEIDAADEAHALDRREWLGLLA